MTDEITAVQHRQIRMNIRAKTGTGILSPFLWTVYNYTEIPLTSGTVLPTKDLSDEF